MLFITMDTGTDVKNGLTSCCRICCLTLGIAPLLISCPWPLSLALQPPPQWLHSWRISNWEPLMLRLNLHSSRNMQMSVCVFGVPFCFLNQIALLYFCFPSILSLSSACGMAGMHWAAWQVVIPLPREGFMGHFGTDSWPSFEEGHCKLLLAITSPQTVLVLALRLTSGRQSCAKCQRKRISLEMIPINTTVSAKIPSL